MVEPERAESTRAALLSFLRDAVPSATLGDLRSFVTTAESAILAFVLQDVRSVLCDSMGMKPAKGGSHISDSDGRHFLLAVVETGSGFTDLDASVVPLTPDQSAASPIRREHAIKPPGRFRRLEVNLPRNFSSIATPLTERIVMTLETGYAWITDNILDVAGASENMVADSLYKSCRGIFPEHELRDEIWFATVGPVFGFRLIAPHVTRAALEALTRSTIRVPVSPLDLLGELLSTRLPREALLMNVAAKADEAVDMDVSTAEYTRAGSRYAFVLRSLYGGRPITMLPLLRADRFAVIALFPAGHDVVRDRLLAHRKELGSIASSLAARIVEAASLFEAPPESSHDSSIDFGSPGPKRGLGHLLGETLDEVMKGKIGQPRGTLPRLRQRQR